MTTATPSTTPSTKALPFGLLNHKALPTAADKQVAAKAALAEQVAAGAKLVQERLEAREAAAAAVAIEVTALVDAVGSTYGKHIAFADAMTLHYAGWHLLSAGDKTETGLAVRAVKDNLFAQLKLVKHDCNPSQVWAKCKLYAVRATTPEAVSGSAPEQSEQDAEKPETEKKSIEVKLREKLESMRKQIKDVEARSDAVASCDRYLEMALLALGGELSTVH
jgi:hypothetical protein